MNENNVQIVRRLTLTYRLASLGIAEVLRNSPNTLTV